MSQVSSLNEVLYVVHFQAPLNLTVVDAADWINVFSDEFPIVQQAQFLPPIDIASVGTNTLIQMPANFEAVPRIILRSPSGPFVLQFQNDRFAFSWTRKNSLGSIDEYPGYVDLRKQWELRLFKMESWLKSKFGTPPNYRLFELTYINALPFKKDNGEVRRLSDVFKFVSPITKRSINAFHTTWTELFEAHAEAPRVIAEAGVGAAEGQTVIVFNFTGVSQAAEKSGRSTLPEMVTALHDRIVDVYESSIRSEV